MEDKKMDVWIITDQEFGSRPMIVSSSKEKAKQQLFDYIGYEGKDNEKVIYKGFEEHVYNDEENERSFIGTFTFEYFFAQKWDTNKFHLYELILDQEQKIIGVDLTKK